MGPQATVDPPAERSGSRAESVGSVTELTERYRAAEPLGLQRHRRARSPRPGASPLLWWQRRSVAPLATVQEVLPNPPATGLAADAANGLGALGAAGWSSGCRPRAGSPWLHSAALGPDKRCGAGAQTQGIRCRGRRASQPPCSIGPLASGVLLPAAVALLVGQSGLAQLLPSLLLTTGGTAVSLPPIAGGADRR